MNMNMIEDVHPHMHAAAHTFDGPDADDILICPAVTAYLRFGIHPHCR